MNSIATVNQESAPEAEQTQLICWQSLSESEKSFVAAYVDCGYSLKETSEITRVSVADCKRLLNRSTVRRAVTEVQASLDNIDFLNEKWVKSQLLRLFPMVMGDEAVPMVGNDGTEIMARKFYPDIAMKVIEYVAPKKGNNVVVINSTPAETNAHLDRLAERLTSLQRRPMNDVIDVEQ